MRTERPVLLIPVEVQVRELDAKVLLAYIAAKRGFISIIGPRRAMHSHLPRFPRGIYVAKSLKKASNKIFKHLRKLGHHVVAWDEEALVRLPRDLYYARRLHPATIEQVSFLLAWGQDNAELWREYPKMPGETAKRIVVTGNPRGDLLRADMRSFYEKDAEGLRAKYEDFILVNTNFSQVNCYSSSMNLFWPLDKEAKEHELGRRTKGMNREYAEGLSAHKRAIFEDFQKLIPALEQEFPDHNIIVRPHPAEGQEVYHRIASQGTRVRVTNDGNVVPWLMAAKALVHNGCTTGVEAYAVGVPAVSYRATINERYDHDYHRLPNLLSHECFSFQELRLTLGRILSGDLGTADASQRQTLIDQHLAARDGPLACELIVDVLEKVVDGEGGEGGSRLRDRVNSWFWATRRRLLKDGRTVARPELADKRAYSRHIYPTISLEQLQTRVSRSRQALGDRRELNVEPMGGQFYRISQ